MFYLLKLYLYIHIYSNSNVSFPLYSQVNLGVLSKIASVISLWGTSELRLFGFMLSFKKTSEEKHLV